MAGEKIFIVEDEKIVAEDLKRMLERLGYKIVGSEANGEKAIKNIEATLPDLVLMDIRIQGPLDGIDVAEFVFAQFNVPVVYLSAYADDITVDRAKGTLPSGYILKPFEERSLKTTIELALYRHSLDRLVVNVDESHAQILASLGVGVMAVTSGGKISYLNKTAENLIGKTLDKVFNKALAEVFSVENGTSAHSPMALSIVREGHRISLESQKTTIKTLEGQDTGFAYILTEVNSPQKKK